MASHRHLNKAYIQLIKSLQDNDGAECEQLPEMFFPVGQDMDMLYAEIGIAKAICNRCPVKRDCLNYALTAEEPFGIWGGLTPAERNILRRRK